MSSVKMVHCCFQCMTKDTGTSMKVWVAKIHVFVNVVKHKSEQLSLSWWSWHSVSPITIWLLLSVGENISKHKVGNRF